MIRRQVEFPLDEHGFFRRECPHCCREFKIRPKEDELGKLAQLALDNYLVDQGLAESHDETKERETLEVFCPYCRESAPSTHWWTQEQLAYIHVITSNIAAKLINETLIRPLNRSMGSGSCVRFTGKEMKLQPQWISPDTTDMTEFSLPCCQREIKIEDDWNDTVHCFFCGFPHTKS